MQLGISARQVTHLFFTHLHYDHCADYARLILTRWDQSAGHNPEALVFGSPPLARMTELLFHEDGVFGPDRHNAAQRKGLFDHLVGAAQQCNRKGKSERFCGLEIDHQFSIRGLLDR